MRMRVAACRVPQCGVFGGLVSGRVDVMSVQSSVLRAAGGDVAHHGQAALLHCVPGPGQSSCGHALSGWRSQIQPSRHRHDTAGTQDGAVVFGRRVGCRLGLPTLPA